MKKTMKRLTSILLVLTIILSCLSVSACGNNDFTEQLKTEIIEDYLVFSGIQSDKTVDEIEYEYFGTYGDSVAIYFHTSGAYETPTKEKVAGLVFNYPDSRVIRIWNNGKFYKMTEAYEMGLISFGDVLSIKIQSLFLNPQEPYFIYEEKSHKNYTLDDPFKGEQIRVHIDKSLSRRGKEFSEEFFSGIDVAADVKEIRDSSSPYDHLEWCQTFTIVFKKPSKEKALEYVSTLIKIDGIQSVEVDIYYTWDEEPNDPLYYSDDFFANSRRRPLDVIGVPLVWDFMVGTRDIKVGIIDSGIGLHEDLGENYLLAQNFVSGENYDQAMDTKTHGTRVAGIVGALGNNGLGIVGVNWETSLIQLKVGNESGDPENIENAFWWSSAEWDKGNHIRVLNLSAATVSESKNIYNAIVSYLNKGGLLVCAAGNENQNIDDPSHYFYPQYFGNDTVDRSLDNIIVVGALNGNGTSRYHNSNYGENTVDIYAPGAGILSTVPTEMCTIGDVCGINDEGGHQYYGYHLGQGTSFAAPYVTGVAALLLSVNPDLTAAQLKECILNGADLIDIYVGDNNDILQEDVRKLNAWGAFKYLMEIYPYDYIVLDSDLAHNIDHDYHVDANASYMKNNTSMIKLRIDDDEEYTFTVIDRIKEIDEETGEIIIKIANRPMKVVLYNEDLEAIYNNTADGELTFEHTLDAGVYYLRTNYTDSSSVGDILVNIECSPHIHNIADFVWVGVSATQHAKACPDCGEYSGEREPHVVMAGSARLKPCLVCGYLVDTNFGIGEVGPFSITKVTLNGSYILPNGIIVLVEEDIEAYFNGTLVFYDKDNLPMTQ